MYKFYIEKHDGNKNGACFASEGTASIAKTATPFGYFWLLYTSTMFHNFDLYDFDTLIIK